MRPAARTANKTQTCLHFGWSRYEFDQAVQEGLPVITAARDKGAEWAVDLTAAERWVREKNEREAARRRYAERERREEEEREHLIAKMTDEQRRRVLRGSRL